MIASQDFRNKYEKFYAEMRQYLWSLETLEDLAEVEVDIYSAFIDRDKLSQDFNRLSRAFNEVLTEDEYFRKAYDDLKELIDDEDHDSYHLLSRVQEVNPEANKVLKLENIGNKFQEDKK